MELYTYTTANAYAVPTSASIDTHVQGRRQVAFSVEEVGGANAAKWKVEGSDDNSAWSEVQAEATIAASATGAFSVAPPRYRYYRVQLMSSVADSAAEMEITIYRHDYLETGAYYGTAVTSDEIDYSETTIDEATADHFASQRLSLMAEAPGGRMLSLLELTYLRCLSVDSLTVIDSAGTSYSSSYDGYIFLLDDGHTLRLDDDCADVLYVGDGRENLTLAGYFGYSSTPAPIVRAAKLLATGATQTSFENRANFSMEKIGDYTYQKSERVEVAFQVTGDPEVDRILRDWRNPLADQAFGAI